MKINDTIESLIAEFTERLIEAVKAQVAQVVAEQVHRKQSARASHPAKGKPATPKGCPVCGTLNVRRRYAFHCEAHTADYLASKAAAQ